MGLQLFPERADGTNDGGSGGKSRHECRSNGKNALRNGNHLLDCRDNLLLDEVLLVWSSSGTEIQFHFFQRGSVCNALILYFFIILMHSLINTHTNALMLS